MQVAAAEQGMTEGDYVSCLRKKPPLTSLQVNLDCARSSSRTPTIRSTQETPSRLSKLILKKL